jgi:triosephosphate isomerase
LLGESDELVRRKLDAVLRNEMVPILCVGEDEEARAEGRAHDVVLEQLTAALGGRRAEVIDALVIAYEPIWAIGTGLAASAEDAEEMAALIRSELATITAEAGENTRVLYGGSVSPDNAGELLGQKNVDGLLVGGASLEAQRFVQIVRAGA